MSPAIPFIDLHAQRRRIDSDLRRRVDAVYEHGRYILGPEVGEFECALAGRAGVPEAIGCANGTDALVLSLRALGVQRGDHVLVPAFTFCATAEAVVLVGGIPVFADVDARTFNLTGDGLTVALERCDRMGIAPVGVIAVDLFGQPADHDALHAALGDRDIWLLDDAAQSFGAALRDRPVGNLARITTLSFFPSKPLAAYGDGGAVLTNDAGLAASVRSLRMHGEGRDQYDNVAVGYNSRLDTLQAAVLLAKLEVFDDELQRRQAVAERYTSALDDVAEVPHLADGASSAWAQYTLLLEPGRRDAVAEALAATGIPTAVYYRRPLHLQPAYRSYPVAAEGQLAAEAIADRVLSLPMHPYLQPELQARIVDAVRAAVGTG